MKLKITFLISLLIILFPLNNLFADEIVKQYKDWYCAKNVDKMEETVDYYIATKSNNKLEGWLKNSKITLFYNDKFILRAKGLGFHIDEYESGLPKQDLKLKVDDKDKLYLCETIIKPENSDILQFFSCNNIYKLKKEMKKGYVLHIEVTLTNTKGRDQIANFSLMGFTKAYNWVKSKE